MCATNYQIGNPDVPQRFRPGDVAMNSKPQFSRALYPSLINGLRSSALPFYRQSIFFRKCPH